MTRRRQRKICGASALALVAGALLTMAGATPAAAAAPGGPYHFANPPGRVIDTRTTGKLPAGGSVDLSAWANHYVNLTVTDADRQVLLQFAPCGGGGGGRALTMFNNSASMFFIGADTCLHTDRATHLIVDDMAFEGPVDDAGLRYVKVEGEPTVLDSSGPGQQLAPGMHPIDVGAWVPPDADGIAVHLAAGDPAASSPMGFASVVQCGSVPPVPQVTMGTLGGFDLNVAHVARPAGSSLCLYLDTQAPVYAHIGLLGYFTDALGSGGDVVPAFESHSELRPGLVPRPPERVLDTRSGTGAPAGKIAPGGVLQLDLSGAVTADTGAVTLSLTATEPETDGYVTAFPCTLGLPDSSNLNFRSGATVPNLVIVEPDENGDVCFFSSARTHLLADLGGTYEWNAGLPYGNEGPRRLLDTRSGGAVAAGSVTTVQVTSAFGGVPAAVTVNLTAVGAGGWGYLTAYPCDQPRPEVSNVNYVGGQTVASLSTVKLAANGTLCLYSYAATHLLVDLAGSYTPAASGRLHLIGPYRWFDTRAEGYGISDADTVWELDVDSPLAEGSVSGMIANLTATGARGDGFFTAFDCGANIPNSSNLNHAVGTDVANLAFIPTGNAGHFKPGFCVYNSATTHVVVDVFARITSATAWITTTRGLDY